MWNVGVVRVALRAGVAAVASFVLLTLLTIFRIIPLHYWLNGPLHRLVRVITSWIHTGTDAGNGIGGAAGQSLVTYFLVNFGLTWLIIWAAFFVVATKLDRARISEREQA
jgi:hypothetical protein